MEGWDDKAIEEKRKAASQFSCDATIDQCGRGRKAIDRKKVERDGERDRERDGRWWRRLLSADGSVPFGTDATGSAHYPHRISSSYCFLPR